LQASLLGRASAVPVGLAHRSSRSQQGGELAISAARAEDRSFPNSSAATRITFARKTLISSSLSTMRLMLSNRGAKIKLAKIWAIASLF